LILGDDDRLRRALGRRGAEVARARRDLGDLLVDLEADEVVLVDVRRELELERDLLALHLREEAAHAEAAERARPAAPAAPAAAPRPSVLTGNGMRWPTEISPSSLFMMRMCGFDSTSTSLLVCSALMSTPNDGMSTVVVEAVPRLRAWSAVSTGPRTPASIVSDSALAGKIVFAGLRRPR